MTVTNWTAASGTWTSAANWSAGVPGAGDTAVFDDFVAAATIAQGGTSAIDGSGETVSGAGVAGTLIVADPASFVGTVTDEVGIIQAAATASDGAAKADPAPHVVLSGAGTAWSSSTGLILTAGTALDVENGAVLSVGAAALTLQAGAELELYGATLSGPVVLEGGTLWAAAGETVGGSVLVSGSGTVLASGPGLQRVVLAGPVSGGALVVGDVTPAPAGTPYAGSVDPVFGTLTLAGADMLPAGISVLYGETLELASPGAGGGGAITMQASAGLVVDAGVAVAQPITVLGSPPGVLTGAGSVITNTDASLLVLESNSGTLITGPDSVLVNAVQLTFINGAGHSTVIGGNGDDAGGGVVFGGTGSVTVFGGRNAVYGGSAGNNLMISTVGDPSLDRPFGQVIGNIFVGGGSGDLLVGDSGGDLLVAGAGNETLSSSGETRASFGLGTGAMIFGATGADVLVAGGLSDTVVAGSGATTMFGGAGPALLDAGNGADVIVTGMGGSFVQGGTGSATIHAGLGANTLVFVDGQGGGTDVVDGFKVGIDRLSLRGFGSGGAQAGVTGSQVVGGSTILTLADNTRITLQGVASLGGASFG